MTIELGVQQLYIKGDSQLVVNQVKGAYQVKDPQFSKYVEIVHRLMAAIKEVRIEHVPRGQNERADVLATLASIGRLRNYQIVIQETLSHPSKDTFSRLIFFEKTTIFTINLIHIFSLTLLLTMSLQI